MRRIFQSNYADAARGAAAAVVWLQQTLESGAPAKEFTAAMAGELRRVENDSRAPRQKVRARQRWRIHAAQFKVNYWELLFNAAIAEPSIPGSTGEDATEEILHRSSGHSVRLLQIGNEEYLASYVTEDSSWYLFDPKTGLWEVKYTDVQQFKAHMESSYPIKKGAAAELSSWVVPFPIALHTTWIGPPQGDKEDRDLMCVQTLRSATLSADIYPKIKFWCLKQFESYYQSNVWGDVELGFIDDQLPEQFQGRNLLATPDFDDLGKSVATILWEYTRSLRPGSSTQDRNNLAFAKDVWSLYCLHNFGGYHFDAGMKVLDESKPVNLPFPTTLGAMESSGTAPPQDYFHRKASTANYPGSAGFGLPCISLSRGRLIVGVMSEKAMPLLEQSAGTCPKLKPIDVPILRSPKGGSGVTKALKTYIYLWFAMRIRSNLDPPIPDISAFIKETVVSSVATGIIHWGAHCPARDVLKGSTFNIERELNLKKHSFQTHVAAAGGGV